MPLVNRCVLVVWHMRSRIPNSSHSRYFEPCCTIGAVVAAAKCGQLNMHSLQFTAGVGTELDGAVSAAPRDGANA
jgi:hypothetical protein